MNDELYTSDDIIRSLSEERTDLLAQVEALTIEIEQMKAHTYCAYCGAEFDIDDAAEHVSNHIATCVKHPMRDLEAEIKLLENEVEQEKENRVYYQDIVYAICNTIDGWRGVSVNSGQTTCCGCVSSPGTGVQDYVEAMIAEIRRLAKLVGKIEATD